MNNADTVRSWCTTWPGLDRAQMLSWFTDDAVFENKPLDGAITGPEAIAATLDGFKAQFAALAVTMHAVVEDGDVVLSERTERFTNLAGVEFDLPVMGAFELRDGKIAAWRDYWDIGKFTEGLGAT